MVDKQHTVVIAEDEPTLRHLLRCLLNSLGYNVVAEATNGIDAIEQVKKHKPDIVCLDVNMPEMDGLEALSRLKMLSSGIIVIMVTGNNTKAEVKKAISCGADGYILKPFTANNLNSSIRKAQESRQPKR